MYRLFFVFLFLIPVCANAQPTNNPAASLRPITPPTGESAESFKARAAELAKQAEEMRQENKKKNDAFRPLLEAAGLQAKAPWQLVGIDVWIAGQGRFTRRMGQLYIRVNSADRAQILLTTLRVVQDIIDANRLDTVYLQAWGNWFTPDVGLGDHSTVEAIWSRAMGDKYESSWGASVAERLPTANEVTVARAMTRLFPYDPNAPITEGTPEYYQAKWNHENLKVANATHLSVPDVENARGRGLTFKEVHVCVPPPLDKWPAGCAPCAPDSLVVDAPAIQAPNNFPNAAQVIDETCKGQAKIVGNREVLCRVGIPY